MERKEMRKIPYGRQTITEEDINAVSDVLRSDYLTQGPVISQFEKSLAEYHNAKYAVAFSNGTSALYAAYHSLGIGAGDHVLSTPITFVASMNGALYCGAEPGFVDMDNKTNCIDISKIEQQIKDNTKVITPVAYAGYPVDLKSVREIADKHNLKVLYDAAHAIGSKRGGTFGMEYVDAAILSFHPVKHIAAGEGGMVLTNSKDIYEKLTLFRTHGITKDRNIMRGFDGDWYYEMHELGHNFRITEMQCALALSQFQRLDDNIRKRNKVAHIYNTELSGIDGLQLPPSLGSEHQISEDISNASDIHSYHLFTICCKNDNERKKLYEYYHSNGIMVQVHYIPVHLQPYYRDKLVLKQVIFLPLKNFTNVN
jgi:dTDP-4-amino-4,6-dideoxygalactose transaminase